MAEEQDGRVAPAEQLGRALRALQQRSGRTLRSLETEVLISDSSLSRYLRGSTVPPWVTVRDLCRALGADPIEYRAMWEAADRCQTATSAASPPTPVPVRTPAGRGPAWVRAVRVRLRSPWMYAAAGVVAGGALGSLLTLLLAIPEPGPGRPVAGPAAVIGLGDKPGRSDAVRPFINRATGRCLDHSLDHGLRTYPCNSMSYQRWTVHALPHGAHQVWNHATGACLISGATDVRAGACGTSASETWSVRSWADESVALSSTATGVCLEDGTGGLRPARCGRTDHQKWG